MSFKFPVREVPGVPRESQVVPRGPRGPRESQEVPEGQAISGYQFLGFLESFCFWGVFYFLLFCVFSLLLCLCDSVVVRFVFVRVGR